MSLYDDVRAILVAPEWEPVTVTNHGAFVTVAGRFNGIAHAGSRADAVGLARDLDRIARERQPDANAAAEAIVAPTEPAPDQAGEIEALRARIAELEQAALDAALDQAVISNPDLFGGAGGDPVGGLEAIKAKIDAVRAGTQELSPQELIDMHRDDPPGAAAKLEDAIRALKGEARRKLSELLNVELAELKNLRGMAGEDREREQQIEYLLGLFTRLGEI